jgi:hypothetical protein
MSWRRTATVFKSDTNTRSESSVARRADGRLIMISRYDVVVDGNRYARLASRVTNTAVDDAAGWRMRGGGRGPPWACKGVAPVLHTMDQGVLMLVYAGGEPDRVQL